VIDFLLELQMMFLVEMIESEEILKVQTLFEMVEDMGMQAAVKQWNLLVGRLFGAGRY
jgi:hypothetical protein